MTDHTLVPLLALPLLFLLPFADCLHLLSQDIGLIFFYAGFARCVRLTAIGEY
jgi:hypothetical protein